jgi:murein DD-endopeptidase MepM/ murein hydrolase activator NlpD
MTDNRRSRRDVLLGGFAALALSSRIKIARAQNAQPTFSYPIGLPGRALGDGLFIRHGFTCENTWYNTGWWHTGEDWYLNGGAETAGVGVFAVASGQVVFAGSEYPGRVVIVQHAEQLYSMYGHLDYDLFVSDGDVVERGQQLGTILLRTEGRAPSHLHFEFRNFLTRDEINGTAPSYGVRCGYMCVPGPGYWPMSDPQLPVGKGWRNPSHAIARRAFPNGVPAEGAEVIVGESPATSTTPLWSAVTGGNREQVGELDLRPGDRFPLRDVHAWAERTTRTTAEAYHVWYQIGLPDDSAAWVEAMVPSDSDTGADGRPSTVILNFLPHVVTPDSG